MFCHVLTAQIISDKFWPTFLVRYNHKLVVLPVPQVGIVIVPWIHDWYDLLRFAKFWIGPFVTCCLVLKCSTDQIERHWRQQLSVRLDLLPSFLQFLVLIPVDRHFVLLHHPRRFLALVLAEKVTVIGFYLSFLHWNLLSLLPLKFLPLDHVCHFRELHIVVVLALEAFLPNFPIDFVCYLSMDSLHWLSTVHFLVGIAIDTEMRRIVFWSPRVLRNEHSVAFVLVLVQLGLAVVELHRNEWRFLGLLVLVNFGSNEDLQFPAR